MTALLRVAESGWSTTIQDFGRPGFQRMGIAVSGALDVVSLQAANVLVENPRGMGAIEVAYIGPTLVAETEGVRLAVVGADARLERLPYAAAMKGEVLPANQSFVLSRGEALRIGPLKGGSVLYIAVEGGFDLPPVLGSLATDVRGGFGGWNGRPLSAGDRLPLRRGSADGRTELRLTLWPPPRRDRIRIVLGPQSDYFDEAEIRQFLSHTFTISPESNRMGMRLNGLRVRHARGFNITSDAVTFGSVQIMGSGQPVIMMADRPTTGGYPKIATVISADLPSIGRLAVGSPIAFEAVSIDEAHEARRVFGRDTNRILTSTSALAQTRAPNLLVHNLISGVRDAMECE